MNSIDCLYSEGKKAAFDIALAPGCEGSSDPLSRAHVNSETAILNHQTVLDCFAELQKMKSSAQFSNPALYRALREKTGYVDGIPVPNTVFVQPEKRTQMIRDVAFDLVDKGRTRLASDAIDAMRYSYMSGFTNGSEMIKCAGIINPPETVVIAREVDRVMSEGIKDMRSSLKMG